MRNHALRLHARRRLALAAVPLIMALAGCGSATSHPAPSGGTSGGSFPAAVAAANGTVHVPKRPHAIVSLSPTATEMLYAIGAGSQVKAVDQNSNYPARAPHTSLSGLTPNLEAILAYKPDLVVVYSDAANLTKRLGALSVPVLVLPAPATLAADYAEYTQLGQATGHTVAAQREVSMLKAQVRHIIATVPTHPAPLSYYYELDQTYYSVTSATFIGKLLALLGLKSIADAAKGAVSAGGYPQLSAEYIIKANPAYIILADTVCCKQDRATVAKRPGWAGLTAVKSGRVIALNDDIASRWGPRIIDLLRTVLAALQSRGGQ